MLLASHDLDQMHLFPILFCSFYTLSTYMVELGADHSCLELTLKVLRIPY